MNRGDGGVQLDYLSAIGHEGKEHLACQGIVWNPQGSRLICITEYQLMAVKSHTLEVYFVHTIPFFPKYVKVRKKVCFYYKVQDNEVKTLF